MRKPSTGLPEQGTQTPSPAPDPIPAESGRLTQAGPLSAVMLPPELICPTFWQNQESTVDDMSVVAFLFGDCRNQRLHSQSGSIIGW